MMSYIQTISRITKKNNSDPNISTIIPTSIGGGKSKALIVTAIY